MLRSTNLQSLNPHITCVLCGGYLVDATTIIECLHSFCRSCIILWLDKSYKCPVCETEIHKTRPYLNIRPDRVLQDIVYKLVPEFYQNELQRRKDFDVQFDQQASDKGNDKQEIDDDSKDNKRNAVIEDAVCVTLEYYGQRRNKNEEMVFPTRYLRCSSHLPVKVLKKFVSTKFGIPDSHFVEIVRSDEILSDHLSLRELWRIYGLHNKAFIDLQYIIIDRKLDTLIAQQPQEQPKFKKIRRRRKRKSSNVLSGDEPVVVPTGKRRRRKRKKIASMTNKTTISEELKECEERKTIHKDLQPENDDTIVSNTPIKTEDIVDSLKFITCREITELSEDKLLTSKAMKGDVTGSEKYACPVTPDSDADHNNCVSLTADHNDYVSLNALTPADVLRTT